MTTVTNYQNINIGNPCEVLASILIQTHDTYVDAVSAGQSPDAYKELGHTVRILAQSLAEAAIPYNEDLEDIDEEEEHEI